MMKKKQVKARKIPIAEIGWSINGHLSSPRSRRVTIQEIYEENR